MKRWLISKDKRLICSTTVRYSPEIEKDMKKAGYKIKEVEDNEVGNNRKLKRK